MKDFFTKVLDKFHHPVGLLLFALGAILILLSVSQGLKIPGLENVVSEPSYRVTSLVIGSLLVLLSVVISLKEPKLPSDLASELSKPLAKRRAKISIVNICGRRQRCLNLQILIALHTATRNL